MVIAVKCYALNLLMYSVKSSPFLYLVTCRVASVTVSSLGKYLVQNMSTMSSQVGIDLGFRIMYRVYARSLSDLKNFQRQVFICNVRAKSINKLAHVLYDTSFPAIVLRKGLWLIPLRIWFAEYP